jgi:hypothetical protein
MSNGVQKSKTWAWILPAAAVVIVVMYYVSPSHRKESNNQQVSAFASHAPKKFSDYTCEVYEVPAGGWGYDIKGDGVKTVIHQNKIPGVPGPKGFPRKEDALKVGGMMIHKIKTGAFPPTVTYQEMVNAGVTLN